MTPSLSQQAAVFETGLAVAVRRVAGPDAEIVATERAPNPYAGASSSEVISTELASGETLSIFVKHLGEAQREHPDKRLLEREVRVYGELLVGRDLPVPRFLGSARDGATGSIDLFLEYVDGWNLKYHGLGRWRTAVRDLARLHRSLAGRSDLLDSDFLLQLNGDYVRAWAGRATASVAALSAPPAERLHRVAERLGAVIALLEAQPPTLVHNDLAPKNAIADTSAGGERTRIVDWEMAGAGCGLLDLAHLTHGLAPGEAERMLEIYARELAETDLLPGPGERERLLAACRLHCTLYRLAHAETWQLPLERVEEWVAESEALIGEAAE